MCNYPLIISVTPSYLEHCQCDVTSAVGNLLKSNGKGGGKYLRKEETCSCTDQQFN